MCSKISIFLACIFIVFVKAKITNKPVTNGFEQRLKNLNNDQKQGVLELAVYKADVNNNAEVKNLSRWFCISSSLEGLDNENQALKKLKDESCSEKQLEKSLLLGNYSMCEAFKDGEKYEDDCVAGLLSAECRAVTMYTSKFYSTYNTNTRNGHWEPYRIFTTLLYSALVKLDKLDPIPPNTKLYRGMDKKFKVPGSGRFYFKHFVSTSLDREVAEFFGTETFIVLHDVPILAARIQKMSVYQMEEEVLISPFEAFEFVSQNGSQLNFKSAKKQDLINNDELECTDELHSSSSKSKKYHFTSKSGSGVSGSASLLVSGLVVFCLLLVKRLLFI